MDEPPFKRKKTEKTTPTISIQTDFWSNMYTKIEEY